MKLSQAEYFLAVAETLNFTLAAKSLFISQPALSRQIAALEKELGVRLFARTSRKVVLTAAGKQLQQDLQKIMAQVEQAKRHAVQAAAQERVHLRLACFDGVLTDDFLPLVMERLRRFIPGVGITLSRRSFQENHAALWSGEVDLLLTLGSGVPLDQGFYTKKIAARRGALVYSSRSVLAQKTPPTPEDFAAQPFLIVPQSAFPEMYQRNLCVLQEIGISDPAILEADNFAALSAYLESGYGYALLADTVPDKVPNLCKFDLGELDLHWVVAVWSRQHPLSETLQDCFRDFEEFL